MEMAIYTVIMFLALGFMLIMPIVILVRMIKRLRHPGDEKLSGWAIAGRIVLMVLSFFVGAFVALMMFGALIVMSM